MQHAHMKIVAVSSSGIAVTCTLERIHFSELGLPPTEINIKKVYTSHGFSVKKM